MDGLSIIIPCYNKEKTIKDTIENLEAQTIIKNKKINVEVICIDDCSTDKTYNILRELKFKYPNITIYRNDTNMGVFATRIFGIKSASKKYIGFMDPDDTADPTFYEELYDAITQTGADIVQTPSVVKFYNKYNKELAIAWYRNMPPGVIEINEMSFNRIVDGNWTTLWNRMFKRDRIIKIASFPPYYINFLEDTLIYLSTVVVSKKICNVKTKGYYYYNLSDNVEHLSKPKGRNGRNIPTAKVFQLLDTFLVESNNMKYFDGISRFRYVYVKYFSREYANAFNMAETFVNNNIDIGYKYNEIAKIRDIYIELLKSQY